MTTLLIILVILALVGAPWGYHGYGWGPSGILALICAVLLILALTGNVSL